MNLNKTDVQAHTEGWHNIDWLDCQKKVEHLQYKIVVAFKSGEKNEKQFQHNLTKSFAARALAVRTVVSNTGRKTPGVDRVIWDTPIEKWNAIFELGKLEGYKASPLRRVWISKNGRPVLPDRRNGRPLGIPTMFDRGLQTLWNLALAPIAECTGDRHSFGFRPYRTTKDAAHMLFIRLSNRHRPHWILEAHIEDVPMPCIEGVSTLTQSVKGEDAFNKISHNWIMSNIPVESSILQEWLKAGHIERDSIEATESGVPQGGPISPTISNMVLDGLSDHIEKAVLPYTSKKKKTPTKSNTKVTMIRYGDDFVVTCGSKELVENVVRPAVEQFLVIRGLNLSPTKTLTTFIEDGFDFLEYNFRLYKDVKKLPEGKVLLIKPSKKSITRIKEKISMQFENHRKSSAYTLIQQLNPILRGWANYHRRVVSKKLLNRIGYYLWVKAWKWARAKHSQRKKDQVVKMYFQKIGGRNWVFTGSKGEARLTLYDIANVKIGRHLLCQDLNPYLPEKSDYFHKRRQIGTVSDGLWDKRSSQLLKREGYLCPVCEKAILFYQEVETHYKLAKKDGGSNTNRNLVVLHRECHKQVIYTSSDKLKARLKERGIIKE